MVTVYVEGGLTSLWTRLVHWVDKSYFSQSHREWVSRAVNTILESVCHRSENHQPKIQPHKNCSKIDKWKFSLRIIVWIPQERVIDYLTRWFHSSLQHPPLLCLTYIAHVHRVQLPYGYWWLPDSPEGVYNPVPHLDPEEINPPFFCSECVLHLWGKCSVY